MLILDHMHQIVAENDLAVVIELRAHHIDTLVAVHGHKTALCQLIGQKRADHFHAFHTYNGVHHRVKKIQARHHLGDSLCLAGPALKHGQIQVIVDVGMVGGKMARDHSHLGRGPNGSYLSYSGFHNRKSPLFIDARSRPAFTAPA